MANLGPILYRPHVERIIMGEHMCESAKLDVRKTVLNT